VLVPLRASNAEKRDGAPRQGPPPLNAHSAAVRERVGELAEAALLSPEVKRSLTLAASAHDLGKADPRMQAYFRGGVAVPGAEPIAKSTFGTRDPKADRRAHILSGWPRRLRHEIASVAALSSAIEAGTVALDGADPDLTLHLVGTHHGYGRPFFPVPADERRPPRPFLAQADGIEGVAVGDGRDGWADGRWIELFWRTVHRYGPWGTAYLEALFVSADRSVSGEGR
jgi:CRISPR-associated endonuclease/helicase Cas3